MDGFISEDQQRDFLEHVRAITSKAFWDNIYADIENGDFKKVIGLVDELLTRLVNLVPNNNKVQEQIKQEIDIELITQQIENNAFDKDDFSLMFDCFCKWITHLQSPAWDESTRNFRNAIKEGIETEGHVKMIRYALDGLNDIITIIEYEVEEFNKKAKELEEQQKSQV